MNALVIRPYSLPSAAKHAYQEQDSPLTLAEGLEEYYRVNRGIVQRPETLPPESTALFKGHDTCHVIFGLDTTLSDETMVDTRTFLSCDVGWKKYLSYAKDPMARAVLKELGLWRSLWITLRTVPRMGRGIAEAWRMTKKWPWTPPESYRTRTLGDLRREFGIKVI